jgi:hypothetical protein
VGNPANLLGGCRGVPANDDGKYVDVKLESPSYCTCLFRGMKETVPFAEAKEFEEQQADAEEGADIELPASIDKVRTTCAENDAAYD